MYVWVTQDWTAERRAAAVQQERADLWQQIKQQRDECSLNGGLEIDGEWFQTDVVSRGRYFMMKSRADALRASGVPGATIIQSNGLLTTWKTMDNNFVPLTLDLIDRIINMLSDREAQIFHNAESLKEAVDVSDVPASVNINLGWPPCWSAAV